MLTVDDDDYSMSKYYDENVLVHSKQLSPCHESSVKKIQVLCFSNSEDRL